MWDTRIIPPRENERKVTKVKGQKRSERERDRKMKKEEERGKAEKGGEVDETRDGMWNHAHISHYTSMLLYSPSLIS